MALWELDQFQGPRFLGFVRNIPVPEAFHGREFLPDRTVFDLDFEYILGVLERPVMASVLAWDAEAPIAGRPALGPKVTGELPPIKRKARISEKEIVRFITPRAGIPDVQTAINYVYDLTARLLDSIQARVEWLRMQALSEDTVIYDPGPDEGVKFVMDYGFNDKYQLDMASTHDGAGNDTSGLTGKYWDDAASDPLKDLLFICDKIQDETGYRPARGVMPRAVKGLLAKNAALALVVRGKDAPTALLSDLEIQRALELYNLPSFTTYDVTLMEEQADGSQSEVRPLAANKVVLLPPPEATLGETLWGPCAESRGLFGTNLQSQAPGIYATTYAQNDPPSEWIKSIGCAFPSLPGANLVAQLTVKA